MDDVELMIFDVWYAAEDSDLSTTDYSRFRAEDEDHARDQFRNYYPDLKIIEVECRGSAF
jgi:hypothetical protein